MGRPFSMCTSTVRLAIPTPIPVRIIGADPAQVDLIAGIQGCLIRARPCRDRAFSTGVIRCSTHRPEPGWNPIARASTFPGRFTTATRTAASFRSRTSMGATSLAMTKPRPHAAQVSGMSRDRKCQGCPAKGHQHQGRGREQQDRVPGAHGLRLHQQAQLRGTSPAGVLWPPCSGDVGEPGARPCAIMAGPVHDELAPPAFEKNQI